jgi:hypothetical protein
VIYAPKDFTVPPWKEWAKAQDRFLPELKSLADRPAEGSGILKGFPICSLLAAGPSEKECRRALADRLQALETHFENSGLKMGFGSAWP